jgi:hypothetical protein
MNGALNIIAGSVPMHKRPGIGQFGVYMGDIANYAF